MNELREIWNDIKNRNFVEVYIIGAIGILVLVADLLGFETEIIIGEVVLAALSALLYLNIKERREYLRLLQNKDVDGITSFRSGRQKMGSLEDLLIKATDEIALYAVKHSVLVHQYLDLIAEKASEGCKIKLLILEASDTDGNVNQNVEAVTRQRLQASLRPTLEESLRLLSNWLKSLDETTRKNIEIRQYQEFPAVTYTFIDREKSHGFVQVEIFIPIVQINDIPHYIVTRRDNERFFDIHCKSFDGIWSSARTLT